MIFNPNQKNSPVLLWSAETSDYGFAAQTLKVPGVSRCKKLYIVVAHARNDDGVCTSVVLPDITDSQHMAPSCTAFEIVYRHCTVSGDEIKFSGCYKYSLSDKSLTQNADGYYQPIRIYGED